MHYSEFSPSALVFGLVFIAIGVLFLLDDYDVLSFNAIYIIPILLIGLGVGVIAGSGVHPRR